MAEATKPPVRRTYGRRVATSSPPRRSLLFTPPPSSPPSSQCASRLPVPSPPRASKRGILDSDPIDVPLPEAKRVRPLGGQDTNRLESIFSTSTSSHDPPAPPKKDAKPKQATLASFFGPIQRKSSSRPEPSSSTPSTPSSSSSAPGAKPKSKLTQLHFMNGARRTCAECGMSYIRGGEDERVHATHHARVTRGIPFSKTRAATSTDVGSVSWKGGSARLVIVNGKGWSDVHATVDGVLSASPLTAAMREHCKLVLAVTSAPPPAKPGARANKGDGRERVIGVVVAQPIKVAMRVVGKDEDVREKVDGGAVMCDPKPLPTPLGIHRLFVVPAYRGTGLARAMLDAAASHTIYGCNFDPTKGEVAFSQPTESGRAVMQAWGKGGVRVFDEGQL